MNNIISLKNLYKSYFRGKNELKILDGIDLEIKRGEYVAILGPSGSGKSTLMNVIGCIDEKTKGTYILDGVSVDKLEEDKLTEIRNKKIGFVFQSFNLIPKYSAIYNVQVPLIFRGMSNDETRVIAEKYLDRVGILDRKDHRPNELSGGQQQRVAIARALVTDPEIILADEPTGNLDSKSGIETLKILKELNSMGKTVIIITHDEDTAKQAGRIIHLRDGKIEEVGGV